MKELEAQSNKSKPLVISEQGSFAVGGSVITKDGTFDVQNALKPEGQTLHGDHAYVFYQIPAKRKKMPLVFLHGAGQSKKTWESTPDGREGFQNIFLRKSYPVYLLDQPRRGMAGRTTKTATITNTPDEQFWFTQFRIGNYPNYFENVQFPRDEQSLAQFYRQMTPNTGPFDLKVISDAISALFDKIGGGVLVTHSQGGGPGWMTAVKSSNVKAIVAYEPYSSFLFPEGEVPASISSTGLFGALKGEAIPLADFLKLTKIPIVIYYGDNIADSPTAIWNKDHWRSGLEMARKWTDTINKHGGDASVVHLPSIGIKGNTHFPFSDLNNLEVADALSTWLKSKGLDK
ncbi:alpha/beta hydrolase [Sphingobacterium bovistauri]|nr:alpha/beta fold hydrolase [Sphingobacterium bovistauri]